MDEEVAMDVEPATGLTTRLTLGSSDSASCTFVLTRLMMASANFPGFLNAEMTPLQVGNRAAFPNRGASPGLAHIKGTGHYHQRTFVAG